MSDQVTILILAFVMVIIVLAGLERLHAPGIQDGLRNSRDSHRQAKGARRFWTSLVRSSTAV